VDKLFKLSLDDVDELEEEQIEHLETEKDRIEKKFKRKMRETNFGNVYGEMTQTLFLLGLGVPKVLWDSGNNRATYENIDIENIRVHPGYKPYQDERPKYLIEYKEMDLAELRRMAKETNDRAGEQVFDMAKVNKIEEDWKKVEAEQSRQQRLGLGQYISVSKRIGILEFWGDIVSEDGLEILPNQLIMLANEKHIIRHQDNPFNHQQIPYVLTYALEYPHRGVAGVSLVEPSVKLQYTYNNVINMYMDNLNFSVNKMFEYMPTGLQNPREILSIFPGKTFEKNVPEQVVREIATTNIGREAVSALETLNREMQEATAVTEFMMGMPGKKSKTLGEVEIKTAESQGLFDVIARGLEQNSIKRILELTYSLYVQFGDMPDIEDVFMFEVGGLSLLIMQREEKEQALQTLALALKSPDVLLPRTDIDDLWRKVLQISNLADVYMEPEERGPSPEEMEMRQGEAQKRGAEQARADVAKMGPQELLRMTG